MRVRPSGRACRLIRKGVETVANQLRGKTVAFLVANEGIEQAELTRPWEAVANAGGRPVLAATRPGKAQAFNHLDKAGSFEVNITTKQLNVGDYAGIVIPGGVANSDQLRSDANAVGFVRSFFESGKPAAVICHGPWTLVEADVVSKRRLTSWPSLKTDIRNAGGNWVDEQVVVCTNGPNTLITSRKPDDLDPFCNALLEVFAEDLSRV
jgi:protease I